MNSLPPQESNHDAPRLVTESFTQHQAVAASQAVSPASCLGRDHPPTRPPAPTELLLEEAHRPQQLLPRDDAIVVRVQHLRRRKNRGEEGAEVQAAGLASVISSSSREMTPSLSASST